MKWLNEWIMGGDEHLRAPCSRLTAAGLSSQLSYTSDRPLGIPRLSSARRTNVHLAIPRRILLVDDHVDGVDALADLFSALGWTVDKAYSGSQAVTLATITLPDVVVMDINMPAMDGFETARRLHEMAAPNLRIVGYSGSAVRPMTRLVANEHIECIVSKGAPLEILMDAVDGKHRA